MKSFTTLSVLVSAGLVAAKFTEADYDSGLVHNELMSKKMVCTAQRFHTTTTANMSRRTAGLTMPPKVHTTRRTILQWTS